MAAGDPRSPIRFNMDISLGNLMSAGSVLVFGTIFILGIRSSGQLEMSELRSEMKVYSTKLEALTRDFNDFKTVFTTNNTEIRQKMDGVANQVGDLRVFIAGQKEQRK